MKHETTASLKTVWAFLSEESTKNIFEKIGNTFQGLEMKCFISSLDDAHKVLQSTPQSPDILIIDLSMADFPMRHIGLLEKECHDAIEVICLGDKQDTQLYKNLMDVGVHDYLLKPLNAEQASQSLAALLAPQPQETHHKTGFARGGKLFSFLSLSGGADASTLVSGCGAILAQRMSLNTAILDLNFTYGFQNINFGAGAADRFIWSLSKAENFDAAFMKSIGKQIGKNLLILGMEGKIGTSAPIDVQIPRKVSLEMTQDFHYTLLDLGYGTHALPGFMHASDKVFLIAEPTHFCLHQLKRFMGDFGELVNQHDSSPFSLILHMAENKPQGGISVEHFTESVARVLPVSHIIPFAERRDFTHQLRQGMLGLKKTQFTKNLQDTTTFLIGGEVFTRTPINRLKEWVGLS